MIFNNKTKDVEIVSMWLPLRVARQPLHFGFFPRKLAGQANSALQLAHTRCGIVQRGAAH